jgi:hypothetical protein
MFWSGSEISMEGCPNPNLTLLKVCVGMVTV